MRVIAGSARGVRLGRVPGGTRPLSDRAREGLFSSLSDLIPGARCADVFAGTGAVGIEALSRGAASCFFVDRSVPAIRTIRENLLKTGLSDRAEVRRGDALWVLRRSRAPFDLAVLDPPYTHPTGHLRRVLTAISGRMASTGTIAVTRPREDANDVIPVHWTVVRLLSYGDARILICREAR